MARKKMMIANWKMNKLRDDVLNFVYSVAPKVPTDVVTVIAAPALYLRDLVKRQGDNLKVAAQNMHYAESGAFTGELSPLMLRDIACDYVILGHSERRTLFFESDAFINQKVKSALKHNLTPVLCFGETLAEREAGKVADVFKQQLTSALAGLSNEEIKRVVLAYEPVWAIGTGVVAKDEDIASATKLIRSLIQELTNANVSEEIYLLYGGSVKPDNVKQILTIPGVDGGLVGGASLDPDSYLQLVNACLN